MKVRFEIFDRGEPKGFFIAQCDAAEVDGFEAVWVFDIGQPSQGRKPEGFPEAGIWVKILNKCPQIEQVFTRVGVRFNDGIYEGAEAYLMNRNYKPIRPQLAGVAPIDLL